MDGAVAHGRAARRSFLHSRATELGTQRPGIVARLRDLPTVLRLAAVVLLVVAAARPQSTRAADDFEVEGIDIVIALDLSGSMQETDLVPNRLEAAKAVIQDFVRRRPTDCIGLVVFGREAYTYAPMTLDHGALLRMVGELRLGMLDGNGTAIGDGIAVALNRLCGEELRRLTEAAKAAAQPAAPGAQAGAGEGAGEGRGARRPLQGDDRAHRRRGQREQAVARGRGAAGADAEGQGLHDPRRRQGIPGRTGRARGHHSVNPKLLEQIASTTGGTPYLASDSRALRDRFQKILAELKRAPIHDRGTLYAELFRPFLLVAFALLAAEIALRLTRFSRMP